MKFRLTPSLFLVALLTMLNVNNVRAEQPAVTTWSDTVEHHRAWREYRRHETSFSNNERRAEGHYPLPRNYSKGDSQRYPVMYVLDGTSQDQHTADEIPSTMDGFLYLSVGADETEQMIGGFNKLVDSLKKVRMTRFRWVADYTTFVVHRDNSLISTSKGLVEWGASI